MSRNNVTTTKNGFKVEDITFRGARLQSEILKEIDQEETDEQGVVIPPVSLTPEQVKEFYLQKIQVAKDSNEKRVYSQTIRWIDEMLDLRKKVLAYEAKEVAEVSDDEGDTEEL